jgi:hypothetical protein
VIGYEGAKFGASDFHRSFDFASGGLSDFFDIGFGRLTYSFRFALGLALGLGADVGDLLIEFRKSLFDLGQFAFGFLFVVSGLFEVFDYRSGSIVEETPYAKLVAKDVDEYGDEDQKVYHPPHVGVVETSTPSGKQQNVRKHISDQSAPPPTVRPSMEREICSAIWRDSVASALRASLV